MPLDDPRRRQGALRGSVADIYLPTWLANRIFPVCGTLYGIALVLIGVRVFR